MEFNPFNPVSWLSAWSNTMAKASARSGLDMMHHDPVRDPVGFHTHEAATVMTAHMSAAGHMMTAAMGGLGKTPNERMDNFIKAWTGQDLYVRVR